MYVHIHVHVHVYSVFCPMQSEDKSTSCDNNFAPFSPQTPSSRQAGRSCEDTSAARERCAH